MAHPERRHDTVTVAVHAARLYYYQAMNTTEIADELGVSRSTVSRLLSWAKDQGLVEIRIHDPQDHPHTTETRLRERFGLPTVKVVGGPATATEREWHDRVATYAAGHLNTIIASGSVVGLAWGTTVHEISRRLTPRQTSDVDIVALNGSGTPQAFDSSFSSEIVSRFALNYGARPHFFPVPAFFDHAETKQALWRERSVRHMLALQQRASVVVYSIGAFGGEVPSHVHSGGFLSAADLRSLRRDGVVGDIATVFFRADCSWRDVGLNARASGPDLALLRRAEHAVCVVSGASKLPGLRAALAGGLMNTLIIDEPSALALLQAA